LEEILPKKVEKDHMQGGEEYRGKDVFNFLV